MTAGSPPAGPRLFPDGLRALNVGLAGFAEPLRAHGAECVQVAWRPPAEADRDLGLLVARLEDDPDDPIGGLVARANADAVKQILEGRPVLLDVQPAESVIPGMTPRMLLHSGPPIEWSRMCGPMRGAVTGAILFEGWARAPEEAEAMAAGGGIQFSPCHQHRAVGPMAGVVSPSMPVFVVENAAHGNRAFATLNEGLGKVLRYGAFDADVIRRLRWFTETLGPALGRTLRSEGSVDLAGLTAQALQMGDECHNRNAAATSLFVRTLAPALVRVVERADAAAALDFIRGNDHFYLNLSMAACKATLDAAHGRDGSTVVTAMSRNGVEFGIRMSGTGDTWFTAPVPVPEGLYFPGYGPADANPDLGDSAITETCGLGGFAMAAAPAIVRFVGGTPSDALETTREMYRITLTRHPGYTIAGLGFAGTPTGIDARRVVESGTLPVINTGIAHRKPGIGQIGAGITRAPLACFADAIRELGRRLGLGGAR
ncbi:MAG TPA: DUF1116 domain-containing protein [bacterium]|nr:DUF1116 domain-containing protein [bacterium]